LVLTYPFAGTNLKVRGVAASFQLAVKRVLGKLETRRHDYCVEGNLRRGHKALKISILR
jgi:hypothetical protein